MILSKGDRAPDFTLPDQEGKHHSLFKYRGWWVLVYFYPEDDTPGCTTEACQIRDNLPHFHAGNVIVLGVSADSVESHKKFTIKYGLPFTLLADEKKEVVEKYGVWQDGGVVRTSFLVDPEGNIAKVYEKVKPDGHAEEVLRDVENLKK